MSIEHLNKTTGFIYENGSYRGSAVIFKWKDNLCVITSGHVIYGKEFVTTFEPSNFTVVDYNNTTHQVEDINGNQEFAKKHDIVLLKLICNSNVDDFQCPKFCTIPKNPNHSLLFRGRYESSSSAVTHKKLTYVSSDEHRFTCDINKILLTNDVFKSGSDWLGGWSGSGIFLDNHPELICVGVVNEIPNKGNDGQIIFSSVMALTLIGFEPEIIESTKFDYDNKFNSDSLVSIIDSFDEETIREWEDNNKDSLQVKHLNRKLKEIYTEDLLEINKRKIIKQLLVGKSYLNSELSKQEQLYNKYDAAFRVYDLDEKIFYASSKTEALKELKEIKKSYETYLSDSIGNILSIEDIKLLAFYGVSEWITNCSLDFIKDE